MEVTIEDNCIIENAQVAIDLGRTTVELTLHNRAHLLVKSAFPPIDGEPDITYKGDFYFWVSRSSIKGRHYLLYQKI